MEFAKNVEDKYCRAGITDEVNLLQDSTIFITNSNTPDKQCLCYGVLLVNCFQLRRFTENLQQKHAPLSTI